MKIAVGMSGGVDSSVAAYLLKEQGHDIVGTIMTIWDKKNPGITTSKGNACYGPDEDEDVADAQKVCDFLKIPLHIIDCSQQYNETVLSYFNEEYCAGRTPNPCVICNQNMKFGILPSLLADSGINFDKFATGHYCRVIHDKKSNRYLLKTGVYTKKDQSYFLYKLSQKQLSRAIFPLGTLTKKEVRDIAVRAELPVHAKEESQDFYSGDYNELLSPETGKGNFVALNGTILGEHKGVWNYTIGQRKGLGVSHCKPLYVIKINAEKNEIVLGENDSLLTEKLKAKQCNYISLDKPERVLVKIRSNTQAVPCSVTYGDDSFSIIFDQAQRAVTPGQSAVLYADDIVIGGGFISKDTV